MAKSVCLVALLLLACAFAATAAETGLVAHWTFDEGEGTTLHDISGLDNHGTIHDPQWVPCGKGHALRFDGADDYVDCGNSRSLDLRQAVTLSAWVWPMAASPQEPGLAGKWFDSYALTLYRGGCWSYISGGGNNVSAPEDRAAPISGWLSPASQARPKPCSSKVEQSDRNKRDPLNRRLRSA